jgi:vacuolar-type H+-ATPase subunit E/Vma4
VRPDSQAIKANLTFPRGDCDIHGSCARRVYSRSQGEAVVDEDLDQGAVDEDVEVEGFGDAVGGVGLEEAVEGGFCEVWG